MNKRSTQKSHWQTVLQQMFEELQSGSPRAEVYWAQQLAFSPVFFYAVVLAVREDAISANDRDHLRRIVPLALSLLGALPDGNGWDLLRELRSHGDVRAIAISGYNSAEDLARSKAAGFLMHLAKPVAMAELDRVFAEVMHSGQSPSADSSLPS